MKLLVIYFLVALCIERTVGGSRNSTQIVLVHGAGHGAWCWYKIASKLERGGYRVHPVDLTSAGINPVDPKTVVTLQQYSSPLIHLIESLPPTQKLILVGHSLGGESLTYVMENYHTRFSAAVFVAANMFPAGSKGLYVYNKVIVTNQAVQTSKVYFYSNSSKNPVAAAFKLDLAHDVLYHLSPSEDVVLAKLLLKPRPLFKHEPANITSDKYGLIPRYYVKTTHDGLISPELQDLMIEYNPPIRVFTLPSDHSPFFSVPHKLVHILLHLAKLHSVS